MLMFKRILILCAAFILTACTTMPASQAPNNQQIPWQQRETQLTNLSAWTVNGAIGIQQKNQANSASLYWQQSNQNNYVLNLQGPLGAGAMKITGTKQQVTMLTGKNKTYTAPNAETLLKAQTGWYLPVSSLYYWAKGLPVPGIPATKKYDQYHHLSQLTQQGWQISYLRYTAVGTIDLPSKIILKKAPFTIKLIFSQWKI